MSTDDRAVTLAGAALVGFLAERHYVTSGAGPLRALAVAVAVVLAPGELLLVAGAFLAGHVAAKV